MTSQAKGFCSKKNGIGAIYEDIHIVAGKRTPFGKLSGALAHVSPTDLGIVSSRAVIQDSGIPASEIDQTIVANIGQASADTFFLPRHIALYSGASVESPALLGQRICGSGIEILTQAVEQIALKRSHVILVCGTDSMSRFPLVSFGMRQGFTLGKPDFIDLLWEALNDTAAVSMGHTADNLAKELLLTRQETDLFAYESQNRYFKALEEGFFKDEIVPVASQNIFEVPGLKPRKFRLKQDRSLDTDENPRQTTLEKLAQLPPVFTQEGPTTAGSASGIVDGACSLIVASGDYIRAHGLKSMGQVRAMSTVGVRPDIMGIGPVPAIKTVLVQMGLTLNDIHLFEINEAFAAQCLGVAKALELDRNKLNIHGGAIAIGHPLAATGCRLALTCLRSLKKNGENLGIISACIGGGQGIAMVLEVTH